MLIFQGVELGYGKFPDGNRYIEYILLLCPGVSYRHIAVV